MALNFPDSPTLNQVYTDSTSGFSYQWNGTVWISFSPSTSSQIKTLDDISASFDGVTQTFALTSNGSPIDPASPQSLIINLGGVIQDPTDDYSVSGSNLIFSTAPVNGLSFSGVSLGPAVPINVIPDGSVTPVKLSTGGPLWNTDGDVTITGTGTTALLVNGNARVTGILTVGTASLTLNGNTNEINGVSISSGIVTASSFVGNVTGNLTGTASTATASATAFGLTGSPNISVGVITATGFSGDGSGLSGVGPSSQDVTSVVGITTIDLSQGNVIYFTHDTDTTVAFANTSTTQEVTFIRTKDNTDTPRNITWPSSVRWPELGNVPFLQTNSSGGVETFKLITRDGGLNWYAWREQIVYGADKYLFSWGDNASGQLGQNNRILQSSPVQIPGTSWSSVSGGINFSLATKTDGTLWAWGDNNQGRLGHNNTINYSSPVQIPGTTWSSISSGGYQSLATKTDGTLWAWGSNSFGSLGQNNITQYSSPRQIPGTTWSSIASGFRHALATKTDGTLWAWGRNDVGQLGHNNITNYSSPVQIPGTNWSSISGSEHSLATKTDGTLWAWGVNTNGRLGFNNTIRYSSPVQIPGTTWSIVSSGTQHSLATKTDGTLWSWGTNINGQLGQNNTTNRSSPVQIPGSSWSSVSGGSIHSLATKTDGTLWSWGANSSGQLGQEISDTLWRSSPVQIPGTTWSSISAGSNHSLGLYVIT
jgi:alpha-tubulin suppressor-like RCC1 family protein